MRGIITPINTVLICNYRPLLDIVKNVLHQGGYELKYHSLAEIQPSDLILVAQGFRPEVNMRYLLNQRYRKQAVVIMRPAPRDRISHDEAKMVEYEGFLRCDLQYRYVKVGTNEYELACYALRAITESFS